MGRWDSIRDGGVADLAFGTHETLRHRGFRHEERTRDLVGGETGERSQGECHLGFERERRVAAREHETQTIVCDPAVVAVNVPAVLLIVGAYHLELPLLRGTGLCPSQAVERAIAGRRREPCTGVARKAVTSPRHQRLCERVLRALLGELPIAGEPDHRRDDPAPLGGEGDADRRIDLGRGRSGHISQIGRTSIVPVFAPGILAAISIASSRSAQSTA
jgi:hypothetical protein